MGTPHIVNVFLIDKSCRQFENAGLKKMGVMEGLVDFYLYSNTEPCGLSVGIFNQGARKSACLVVLGPSVRFDMYGQCSATKDAEVDAFIAELEALGVPKEHVVLLDRGTTVQQIHAEIRPIVEKMLASGVLAFEVG